MIQLETSLLNTNGKVIAFCMTATFFVCKQTHTHGPKGVKSVGFVCVSLSTIAENNSIAFWPSVHRRVHAR